VSMRVSRVVASISVTSRRVVPWAALRQCLLEIWHVEQGASGEGITWRGCHK
jgi:hypothetical protein